ncbi:hypothetical protein V6R98_27200 [Agrobacterium sp. CCNWLW71]|uniref:hypothetical protein n=1 Tax=Rhizobium/Agrobacterium group TaxID=227290 RepID=UPI0022B6FF46|nr:hypothetical protein [Rhizobium rhizogenes]MCZ7451056.1 hypothetical protein [Rhizobium rhizogenes]
MVTYFVVQTFQRGKKGALIPDIPRPARDLLHCERVAEKLAERSAGVVAFSRTGDPESDDWEDAKIISQYGETPSELLALAN